MANEDVKRKIEKHLSNAIQYQKDIEKLTAKLIEELEKAQELSSEAGEIAAEAEEEAAAPEVYKIPEIEIEAPEAEIPSEKIPEVEAEEAEEAGVDFTKELEKVKKIKEMLGEPEEAGPEKEEIAEEEKREVAFEKPAKGDEITFEVEEKVEPGEVPPSEKEIELAIGEEPLPEEEKTYEIEEKETIEAPALEKEPEITIEEEPQPEEAPELEIKETVEAPSVEKEEEVPFEEKAVPEEPGTEIEESETMQTMFSGRWKKHWQEKPKEEEEKERGVQEKEKVAAAPPEERAEETIKAEPPEEIEIEIKPEKEPEVEIGPEAGVGVSGPPKGRRASDMLEILNKYKKSEPEKDGEVYYYEYEERAILDTGCIIDALNKHLQEGKNLYVKLADTESPKDQFFVKQEIIRHQEELRGIVEIAVKLLEKENRNLPQHTINVINEKVLKEMLENLSMQNWSNQDDFTFFDEYAMKIMTEFEAATDPKVEFLKSMVEELGL
jgi:hypothetical protein